MKQFKNIEKMMIVDNIKTGRAVEQGAKYQEKGQNKSKRKEFLNFANSCRGGGGNHPCAPAPLIYAHILINCEKRFSVSQ